VVKTRNITEMITEEFQREWDTAKPYEDMPGPKPLPVIGNFWRFLPYIGDIPAEITTQQDYLHRKYGDIVKMAGLPGRSDMVMIYDPDEIEKVFRNEGPWPIRDTVPSVVYYRMITRKDVFQDVGGLVITQGQSWKNFRSKVNQTMMQPRSTKLYVGPIDSVANDFLKRIRMIRDDKLEMPDDFGNELCKWGLESISYIALDTRLGCLNPELTADSEAQKMIDSVQVQFDCMHKMESGFPVWKYVSSPTWRKFVKASDFFIEVSMKYINQAMQRLQTMPDNTERELTVLEKLLIKDPDHRTAVVMALDMMGAGIDTTSFTVATALYHLAKNPGKQQKLFEEIQRYLPVKEQPVTSNILNELKYLKACIKESMRMSTIVVGNARETVKDMVLADYKVPKGTNILMPLLMLSNLEKYYEEAHKFIPERWIKDDPHYNRAHSFVTMPFGFGPRMCIGRRFAELEIETLLTKIIRNFKVEYNYEMKFVSAQFHMPASPLKFKMIDRDY
ncbi:putative cytochrome P450 301a1, mitochondrial, partial [Zootermopsis nevadensis]